MGFFNRIYRGMITEIRDINRKYAAPSIRMTPFVKFSLLFLRFYLLTLVGLLIYKFVSVVRQ